MTWREQNIALTKSNSFRPSGLDSNGIRRRVFLVAGIGCQALAEETGAGQHNKIAARNKEAEALKAAKKAGSIEK